MLKPANSPLRLFVPSGSPRVMTTPSAGPPRKQKEQRVRFTASMTTLWLFGCLGPVTGHSNSAHNGPLPRCTPYRTSTSFGSQRPRQDRPPAPLAVRGAAVSKGVRRGPARMGPKPSREAMPAFRRREPTFVPAERADGTRAFMGPDGGALCPPRFTSFASGPAGPLLRFFEISCCHFEISIRRPEAHLAGTGADRDDRFGAALMVARVS
jgi:hypothetical protein